MDGNVEMNLDSITGEPLKLAVTEDAVGYH